MFTHLYLDIHLQEIQIRMYLIKLITQNTYSAQNQYVSRFKLNIQLYLAIDSVSRTIGVCYNNFTIWIAKWTKQCRCKLQCQNRTRLGKSVWMGNEWIHLYNECCFGKFIYYWVIPYCIVRSEISWSKWGLYVSSRSYWN